MLPVPGMWRRFLKWGGGRAEGRLIQKIKNLDKQKKENFSKS